MPDRKKRGISNAPIAIQDVPDTPTVSASDVGTSRAYNNGAATVTLTSPTGGAPTSYSITTTPTTTTTTSSTGSATITGLSSATSYTVSATATNGTGVTTSAGTSSSFTATTVPQAPTMGTPSVATGQSYTGTASVSVPFTAGATGGSSITGYTVTSSSGNTGTGASSPISVTGETVGTARTYTVTATNTNGTSSASSASASTTPSSVPQAPTIGTFTDGGTGTTGTLSFTANATGGSAITNYKTSTDNTTYTALSPAQTTSPLSLSGLSVGTATYYIKAVNANGDSAASSGVSGSVITPNSFESIATATGAGNPTYIEFTSIPSNFKHLQIRTLVRDDFGASGMDYYSLRFNSDTASNYSIHRFFGDGSTVTVGGYANTSNIVCYYSTIMGGEAANLFAVGIVDILDYTNTSNYKTVRFFGGGDTNSTAGRIAITSGNWRSTSAISTIRLTTGATGFNTNSTFALYGIKEA